jgi:hypothetical protein
LANHIKDCYTAYTGANLGIFKTLCNSKCGGSRGMEAGKAMKHASMTVSNKTVTDTKLIKKLIWSSPFPVSFPLHDLSMTNMRVVDYFKISFEENILT